MPKNGSNRQPQLLSDAPATEDAFEGGHNRVAEALAGLIQDEEGGKAVALKGPFGSGKSTVVQLLENELEEVDKEEGEETRIFTYDAWEHQGDPLRRSFIESLVEYLEEKGWAEEDEWEDEIDRIARRKEKTEHKTEPVLTKWGRKVALALFLSPLGLAGFAVFARAAIGAIQADDPSWWSFGGFIGLAIIALLCFFWPLVQYKRARQNTSDDDGDPFYLFFQKTQEKKETKTIRTPDPTTIEFQEIFRDIISQTLEGGKRQLIVVVDNLDRLPPEQALSTWATMRTFFETEGENEDEWMDRFWLVVPLNFEALRGVFTTDGKSKEGGEEDDSDERRESNAADSVEAFANKTFSTVFRVAPPVLSDWEQFMKDQLREAFESGDPDDFHAVYRLYRISGVADSAIPTPRDIKIFINRLSGLYRQWGDEISLPVLAAYQLKSGEISQDGQELTNSEFLAARVKGELQSGDWQKQFAALHFNVKPDKATQILIGEQVQTALETGNEEEDLEEFSDVAGFPTVIDRAVPDIVRGEDPSPISLAALALDSVSLDADDVDYLAWRKLRDGIRKAEDWYPKEDREGKGLLSIIRRAPEHQQDELAKHVLDLVSGIAIEASVQDFPNDATRWVDGVLPLVRAFADREEFLRNSFHVPSGWPTYISVISHLAEEENAQRLANFFVPSNSIEMDGIDTAVAEMVSADSVKPNHLQGIKLAKHIDPISDVDWTETSDAIQNRLTWNNNLSDEQLRMHLRTAIMIAAVHGFGYLQNKLGDNTGRSNLSHHLQNYRNDDQEITALCVLLRVLYSADENHGNNNGNASQGHNQFDNILQKPNAHEPLVQEAANLIEEFGISWELLNASRQQKALSFIQEVVQHIASKSNAATLLDHNAIAGFPDVIGNALQGDEKKFKTLVLENDQAGDLSENLADLPEDEWMKSLKNEGRVLDIVLFLAEEQNLQLPSTFQDALHEHARWTLNQQSSPTRLLDEWGRLLNALSEAKRNSLLQSLQRSLLSESDQSLSPVLSMYEDAIINSGVAAEVSIADPTEAVNERFRSLLQRADPEELDWLSDVLQGNPDLASNTDDEIWTAFQELIEEKYKETYENEEVSHRLERIANLTGVDLPDPDEGSPANEEGEE